MYPMTTQYSLYIGKTQKDIPNMYNPESAVTIGILGFLRKKPQGTSGHGSSSKKEGTPKAAHVSKSSNPILWKLELMVQNPPPNGVLPTLVKGSTTIVEEPELEVGPKCPIEMVDAVIERVTGGDPSPHNALPTLQNPIHITGTVVEDGINIQLCIEIVHNVKENISRNDTVLNWRGHQKIQA
jgi:hypothetical protein